MGEAVSRCTTTMANRPVCAESPPDNLDFLYPELAEPMPQDDWAAKGEEVRQYLARVTQELDEAKRDPAKAKCRKEPWL